MVLNALINGKLSVFALSLLLLLGLVFGGLFTKWASVASEGIFDSTACGLGSSFGDISTELLPSTTK
uniref:Uncharacterized protein n=1 Tax=Rhizophora mucronata TaxID=61149 RepID=A0A2P2N884_RHIMU